jgi:hypothetical protein
MSELLPPRISSKSITERLTKLNKTIATLEAAKRYPNHNDDLLKALRLERDRLAALAPAMERI